MEMTVYHKIDQNKALVVGNNAINLNCCDFYNTLLKSYENMKASADVIKLPKSQMNLMMIQQIYLDLFNSNNVLSVAGVELRFSDDVWDFVSQYKEGKNLVSYKYIFDLSGASDYHKIIMKLYVLYNITEYGLHCGSNHGRFGQVKRLIKYMVDNNIDTIEQMTLSDYQKLHDTQGVIYTTYVKSKRCIRDFLLFYSLIANDVYTKAMKTWFEDIDTNKVNATIEANKTPLLPSSFYQQYANQLYETAFNANEDKYTRGACGLLYIGTQTGLRAAELTILRVQDLEVITFRNKTLGILHYRSTKSGNGKNKIYDNGRTFANQKVIEIYKMLISLFDAERTLHNTDFLTLSNMTDAKNDEKNVNLHHLTTGDLCKENGRFCAKHGQLLNLINSVDKNSFCGCVVYKKDTRPIHPLTRAIAMEIGLKDGDYLSYPTIKQFRVYVASELRERGIDDRTTASIFNHHCVEMYGYYARPKHEVQEDIDFSKEIVRDIVRDQTKILGPKGDALTEKINGIIRDNNFHVEKDLDAIIDAVCNEVPIRAKLGGFCMKSNPRRECRHDAETDEFLCAYGCCPNHCHMYFMLPISYNKVKTLKKTCDYNAAAGYVNASEKEAYKLLSAINKELLPELNETRNELKRRSAKDIVKAHPEMADVIDKLDQIEEEVLIWKREAEEKTS